MEEKNLNDIGINYQIMDENQKNEHGRYVPDIEKLKQTATCSEELEYIEELVEWYKDKASKRVRFDFAFNMIYVTRQACGHFEIFQTPCNEYYSLDKNLENAKKWAVNRKCTRCICKINYK